MKMSFRSCLIVSKAVPDASVRRLVSMMILKEGFAGMERIAQLFEQCEIQSPLVQCVL